MKNQFVFILSLFLLIGVLSSCMKETELTYTGDTVVEFRNHLFGRNASYLPEGVFASGATTPIDVSSRYVSADNRGTDSILVQLVGPQQNTDIQVNFSLAETTTAIEGTHFTFRSSDITIPANSSSGYIFVDLIPGSVAAGEVFALTVNLDGNAEILPSENYRVFTVYIQQ